MAVRGRPFEKGNPGGPGRPKGQTVRSALKQLLGSPKPGESDKTRRDVAVEKLWEAAEGSPSFLLDVLKWLEGSTPRESAEEDEEDDAQAVDESGNPIEP